MESEIKTAAPAVDKEEIKRFYKQDVLGIVKKVLIKPVGGSYELFTNRSDKSYLHSLLLMASAAVVCMILVVLAIPSSMRSYSPWGTIMFKSALATIVFLLLLSACSFGIKLLSGKPDFKSELLTGGLSAIPFTAMMVITFISSKVLMDEDMMASMAFGGYDGLFRKAGFIMLIIFYCVLLLVNILQQSLRAGGTNETLAWYISPVAILLSAYLTVKIF